MTSGKFHKFSKALCVGSIPFICAVASSTLLLDLYHLRSPHQLNIFMWLPRYRLRDLLRLELIQPPLKTFVVGHMALKQAVDSQNRTLQGHPMQTPSLWSYSLYNPRLRGRFGVSREYWQAANFLPQAASLLMSFVQGSQVCLTEYLLQEMLTDESWKLINKREFGSVAS